jgi:hypothetical protein
VLKLGAGGALYADADRRSRVPAAPARVTDTTGAGDALCEGFLAAWLAGAASEEALRRGVDLAARRRERGRSSVRVTRTLEGISSEGVRFLRFVLLFLDMVVKMSGIPGSWVERRPCGEKNGEDDG